MSTLKTAQELVDLKERLDALREEIRAKLVEVDSKSTEHSDLLDALEKTGSASISLALAAYAVELSTKGIKQ